MAKPEPSLADMVLGRARRTTTVFLSPTGGIERPKPAPDPEPKPSEEPPPAAAKVDPADEELAALRTRQAELADIRRELDQHGRDLRWLTTFGMKAPRFGP